ncbi:hypothetical protein [Synechococcus sp. CS-1328]|uniref:hypothetical protein n=1 Tax=Synechococcus sp. CS-1328 TaxID=2847976 RepID=UPI00223BB45B|nr:hypothetical protein [Synechococcus sp. CS-1328]
MFHLWGKHDPLKAPCLQRVADLEADAHVDCDKHHGMDVAGLLSTTAFAGTPREWCNNRGPITSPLRQRTAGRRQE